MPRKSPKAEPIEVKTDDANEQEADSPSTSVRRQIAAEREYRQSLDVEELLASLSGEEARVAIKDINPNGTTSHVTTVELSAMGDNVNEYMRREFGSGRWRLLFEVKEADTEKYRVHVSRDVTIFPGSPKGEFFKRQEQQRLEEAGVKVATGGDTVDKLVDALKEKLATGGNGSNETLAVIFPAMITMFTESQKSMTAVLAAALGGRQSQPQNQSLEMLQVLKVFKELNEGGGGEKFDPMRMLEFAHKLSKEFRDRDEDEPPWVKMVPHIVSLFAPKQFPQPPMQVDTAPPVAGQPAPAGAPAPLAPQLPGPQIQFNAQPENAPQPTDEMFAKFLPIKTLAAAILPKLLAGIESGAEPEDALDMFNNPLSPVSLTDAQYDDLVDILEKDGWLKELFGEKEFSEKQTEWITRLRDLILKTEKEVPTEGHEQ